MRCHLLLLCVAMSAFGGRSILARAVPLARVTGAVFDSLASQPIANALVQLVAEEDGSRVRSTRSDAAGRFSFDSVVARSYFVGVLHPRVDALLLQPPTRRLTVRAGTATEGSLSLPSARTLRGAYCGANAARDSSIVVFVGRLRRTGEARTSTKGRVRAEWAEYLIDEKDRRNEVQGVEAITNGDGAFALCGLPLGTHALETQAIGLAPQRTPVDIVDSISAAAVEIVLAPVGQEIDTVRVNATRVALRDRWRTGFEERRKQGHGHFIDEATAERRNPIAATDLLRSVPGVRAVSIGANRNSVRFTRHLGSKGYCEPNVFVGGMLLRGDGIDDIVSAREVRSVEVHNSAAFGPAEFTSANGCGTIVIWRGMRIPRPWR